jgi:hypothetical protein
MTLRIDTGWRLHGRTSSLSSSGRSSWAIVARIPLTNPLEPSVEYSLASSTASEVNSAAVSAARPGPHPCLPVRAGAGPGRRTGRLPLCVTGGLRVGKTGAARANFGYLVGWFGTEPSVADTALALRSGSHESRTTGRSALPRREEPGVEVQEAWPQGLQSGRLARPDQAGNSSSRISPRCATRSLWPSALAQRRRSAGSGPRA